MFSVKSETSLSVRTPAKKSGAPRAACVASCPTGAIVRIDPGEYVDEIYERQG